jgi:signal peptidase II
MIKSKHIPLITIFGVLLIDQFIKIFIKVNYSLGEVGRLGNWCIIHFTENPGMAFGYEFGGEAGKLALSIFRVLACVAGFFYIKYIVKKGEHIGFIFSVSLILAGAMGNILDSAFYGLIFDKGTLFNHEFQEYVPYDGIAKFSGNGYAKSMYGCVVDMFYFPIINGRFPSWFPFWAGEEFQFFRPIFNFADASISVGVAVILIFQKRFSKRKKTEIEPENQKPNIPEVNTSTNLNTGTV